VTFEGSGSRISYRPRRGPPLSVSERESPGLSILQSHATRRDTGCCPKRQISLRGGHGGGPLLRADGCPGGRAERPAPRDRGPNGRRRNSETSG
jgi:hypothetical protein